MTMAPGMEVASSSNPPASSTDPLSPHSNARSPVNASTTAWYPPSVADPRYAAASSHVDHMMLPGATSLHRGASSPPVVSSGGVLPIDPQQHAAAAAFASQQSTNGEGGVPNYPRPIHPLLEAMYRMQRPGGGMPIAAGHPNGSSSNGPGFTLFPSAAGPLGPLAGPRPYPHFGPSHGGPGAASPFPPGGTPGGRYPPDIMHAVHAAAASMHAASAAAAAAAATCLLYTSDAADE